MRRDYTKISEALGRREAISQLRRRNRSGTRENHKKIVIYSDGIFYENDKNALKTLNIKNEAMTPYSNTFLDSFI